jgi:hypothetical protein
MNGLPQLPHKTQNFCKIVVSRRILSRPMRTIRSTCARERNMPPNASDEERLSMTNDSITTARKNDVEIEVVICQKIVRKKRAELAQPKAYVRPQELPREIIRIEHHWYRATHSQYHYRGVPNEYFLGDLS